MQLWVFFFDSDHFPIEQRERVAAFLHRLDREWRSAPSSTIPRPEEWLLLTTCYRVELYGYSSEEVRETIRRALSEELGWLILCLQSPQEVFERLALIAGGVLSPTIGEPQIAHQVKTALAAARTHQTVGPVLTRMAELALHCAHRIRHETRIQEGHLSVPALVARVVRDAVPPERSPRVFILGTGEMARLTLRYLHDAGYDTLTVAGRDPDHLQAVGEMVPGIRLCRWPEVSPEEVVRTHEVIVSASSADHYLWHPQHFVDIAVAESALHRLVVDLAVPRDVHPDVGRIAGVVVWTVDDLKRRIEHDRQFRLRVREEARQIAHQSAEQFARWFVQRAVDDIIRSIRVWAESQKDAELERLLRKYPWTDREIRLLHQFAHRLLNKVLHPVYGHIRALAGARRHTGVPEVEHACASVGESAAD